MKINVKSLTPATLTINCLGNYVIHGRETAFNIDVDESHLPELRVLERSGLVVIDMPTDIAKDSIRQDKDEQKTLKSEGKSRGRPKGAKNKKSSSKKVNPKASKKNSPKASKIKPIKKVQDEETKKVTRNKTVSEAVTDEMGSKVVVCVPGGVVNGHMTNSVIKEAKESIKAEASIKAMEDLEAEERAELQRENNEEITPHDKFVINESDLDASERMGEQAVISTGGKSKKVNMVNSVLPSADEIKNRDPFIDREDTEAIEDDSDTDDFLEL